MIFLRGNILLSYGFLIFIVTISSCNAQEKSIEKTSNGIKYDLSLQNTDPLFYIDGQLCAWVRNIFEDSNGNLWFGTNHYGVMKYDGDTLLYFGSKDGLGEGRINTIVEDHKGNIWFGNFDGLSKYELGAEQDSNKFSNYSIIDEKTTNDVWSVIIDRQDNYWIGTSEGVFRFDGQNFTSFPLPKVSIEDTTSVLSYHRVTSLIEDRLGNIWFGTDGFGVWKFDPKTDENGFSHITKNDGIPGNNISGLLEDSRGHIWIATMYGGISEYNGESFINYTQQGVVKGVETGGLFEDSQGNIWFSAEGNGVYRFNGKSFTQFNRDQGLESDGIISIFEDSKGRFWVGGWGGLFRFYPSKYAKGERSFYNVNKYGPWN